MAFGKLYMREGNPRSVILLALAKANKLDIEVVDLPVEKASSADYQKLNKLGKIPTFEGEDGYVLTECIAIAIYLTSQNEKTSLLGKTKKDYATILQWLSYANSELLPSLAGWFRPLKGMDPYNKKNVEDAKARALKTIGCLEQHLLVNTYLVGERLTLADLFTAIMMQRGFANVLDKKWREENPNTTRWYDTVYNQSILADVAAPFEFIETAPENKPPANMQQSKKEPKKEAKKEAPAKKAKEVDEEEDEAPAAPKAKHPLEALGKPTFALDDWKRTYSNEETREVALPWFWENTKFDEYSIWRVNYKYNDELTMTFMTANLIGGFFARLEGSRKYIFGAASVYGVTNDSIVRGAFVIRGQEALPAFDVAPDYESYEFTKLDPTKAEDKTFVDDMWAWDKPIEVEGKKYEWADGKVFK
ncbi:eEF1-gamma domain-containing protein [Aulographum hederae CBS 113979]|uniref:EEF1-gamma domain-containing protein n=1 Tax=Aulographum hederae CBS 113979 TaxID=1176131 RepID=A0A6G1H0K4_9PEZI|nr:eEF1-gamma domain-containing protein [Aulographum hederae CBS 113979]